MLLFATCRLQISSYVVSNLLLLRANFVQLVIYFAHTELVRCFIINLSCTFIARSYFAHFSFATILLYVALTLLFVAPTLLYADHTLLYVASTLLYVAPTLLVLPFALTLLYVALALLYVAYTLLYVAIKLLYVAPTMRPRCSHITLRCS